MALRQLMKAAFFYGEDENAEVEKTAPSVNPGTQTLECEDREVNLKPSCDTRVPFAPVTQADLSTQLLRTPDAHTVKRMREQENALSSKIIQNLQTDKATFAAKMEVLQGLLSAANERCAKLEGTVSEFRATTEEQAAAIDRLKAANEEQSSALEELRALCEEKSTQVVRLNADNEQKFSAIEQLKKEVEHEKAKQIGPVDATLLKTTKRYLKRTLDVQEARQSQQELSKKADCLTDSAVPNCQGCHKEFGITKWRYQCRRCGKGFCGICSTTVPDFTHAKGANGPRQRSCHACFKLQEEAESKRQKLQQSAETELCLLNELGSRSEVDFSEIS